MLTIRRRFSSPLIVARIANAMTNRRVGVRLSLAAFKLEIFQLKAHPIKLDRPAKVDRPAPPIDKPLRDALLSYGLIPAGRPTLHASSADALRKRDWFGRVRLADSIRNY